MKIKKITKINNKISNFVFNLRNKSYVRKNSINLCKIKKKIHTNWIKKFLNKKNKLYIILEKNVMIGYIRLELDKKIFNTSWAFIKKFNGKGYAKKSLSYVTKNKQHKYKALIKTANIASINVAINSKFKFKKIKKNLVYLNKN